MAPASAHAGLDTGNARQDGVPSAAGFIRARLASMVKKRVTALPMAAAPLASTRA